MISSRISVLYRSHPSKEWEQCSLDMFNNAIFRLDCTPLVYDFEDLKQALLCHCTHDTLYYRVPRVLSFVIIKWYMGLQHLITSADYITELRITLLPPLSDVYVPRMD